MIALMVDASAGVIPLSAAAPPLLPAAGFSARGGPPPGRRECRALVSARRHGVVHVRFRS